MNTKKATKRALLTSIMALVMCVVMLVGTTFAWFTDTASTAVNKIQAGNLKVLLVDENGNDLEGKTLEWKTADNRAQAQILWEPGCTYELQPVRVKNDGNLALKYKIVISGIDGDAKLNEAIDWTISYGNDGATDANNQVKVNGGAVPGEYFLLPEGAADTLTIKGHMKEEAGNEYQGLSIDGIGITVYATQYTYENDSKDNTYDEDATYGTGATIIGLDGTYDSLTAAAKAWRESKGVVTSGNTFGLNSLGGTVDSIAWVISGEVAIGDGKGVIGSNGAGQSILGGGYFTPSVTVNNIIVKGVNDAKIAKTGDRYLVSAAGQNVVYENITFADTVRIDSNPGNLTFKNCKFEAGFRMPHANADGKCNVTIENCTFTGNGSDGYAIFAQGNMASFTINGNTISNCQRGINVQTEGAAVTINGNTIKNITGKTDGFTYGSAIQLTRGKTFTVTKNTISDVAVNALHIYDGCAADSIVINDNDITAAYLCWNEANYTNITSSGNTLNITHTGKCVTKTEAIDSDFALN